MSTKIRQSIGPKEIVLKTLLAGGIAGCCAKSTVAPFDRVKILLQAHHVHYRHLGILSTVNHVVTREGLPGLFRGNGAQMLRIFPYAATQFASYEQYKVYLQTQFGRHHWTKLVAGSLAGRRPMLEAITSALMLTAAINFTYAMGFFKSLKNPPTPGMTAVILTYPLDVIRARLAFQCVGEILYTGVFDAFRVMVTQEGGVRALYKGIVPTMIGMAPYAGLSFYSFETLKDIMLEYFPEVAGRPCPHRDGDLVLVIPAKLFCGGVAGALAQTISYPLDVARRKMQLALMLPESHKFSSWYSTLLVVVEEHGIRHGLFRGLTINYIKVTPMVAMSFSVYETMKQFLGLDTYADR